jgi:hypothetical protein
MQEQHICRAVSRRSLTTRVGLQLRLLRVTPLATNSSLLFVNFIDVYANVLPTIRYLGQQRPRAVLRNISGYVHLSQFTS